MRLALTALMADSCYVFPLRMLVARSTSFFYLLVGRVLIV